MIICYLLHGGSYIVFSQMESFGWALVFIAGSILGATHHDWGGVPFLVIGVGLLVIAFRRRA